MSDQIVPFGKYKGQPVDLMLQDTNYCDWLKDQAGIKDRYPEIHVTIINYQKSEDSLEHNLMQMKFLKDDYVIDLLGKTNEWIKDYIVKQTNFEFNGWDVYVQLTNEHGERLSRSHELNTKISKLEKEIWNLKKEQKETRQEWAGAMNENYFEACKRIESHNLGFKNKIENLENQKDVLEKNNIYFNDKNFFFEIKPIVSDDFPNVMRQIETMSKKIRHDLQRLDAEATKILLVGEYTGQGATQDEFIAFMKTKDINVIFA